MMIPSIRDLSKNSGLPATKLYIPLSYASILGGTCTLIGTATNLVIGGMLIDAIKNSTSASPYMREMSMFDPGLIGLPVTIIGLIFLITVGKSAVVADLLSSIGGNNAMIGLIVVFCGCIFMDTLVTNVASAVFMFPIALMMAEQLDVSFMPFVMTVLVGASCSFISPVGYQTNLMVYGPGGYTFLDYVKIGVPLTIVVGIVTIALIPFLFPF